MGMSGQKIAAVVAIVFTLTLSACTVSHPKKTDQRPSWIDAPPDGGLTAAASASYEIFGEAKARESAILKALSMIALQKSNRVNINGNIDHTLQYSMNGNDESLRESASVSMSARVNGREIPVNAKVIAYWKNKVKKRIWVLMKED